MVAIERLYAFGAAFAIPVSEETISDQMAFYAAGLGHLAADVLEQAVNRTINTWKWGNRLPLPGDVVAHIPDSWGARRLAEFHVKREIDRRARLTAQRRAGDEHFRRVVWPKRLAELRALSAADTFCE